MAFAGDSANIKVKLNGALKDNRYFLCMEGVGCLSVLAGDRGKVYPVYHSIVMDKIYIANMDDFSVHPQGLPSSCDKQIEPNQTVTITGTIVSGPNKSVHVTQLKCSIS